MSVRRNRSRSRIVNLPSLTDLPVLCAGWCGVCVEIKLMML